MTTKKMCIVIFVSMALVGCSPDAADSQVSPAPETPKTPSAATMVPEPTATLTPEPTSTPVPTSTAIPTSTADPTPTADPATNDAEQLARWQAQYNDEVAKGGDSYWRFMAETAYPRGAWTVEDIRCSFAGSGYGSGSIVDQWFLSIVFEDPSWQLDNTGQFGGGDIPGGGTYVVNLETGTGQRGQAHFLVNEDGVSYFPTDPGCSEQPANRIDEFTNEILVMADLIREAEDASATQQALVWFADLSAAALCRASDEATELCDAFSPLRDPSVLDEADAILVWRETCSDSASSAANEFPIACEVLLALTE